MANFMKHNADEIDLVRCWIAIRSQIPIGRAVKRGIDVRTVGVNVISHQLIGQSDRVIPPIERKRPTRQRVVSVNAPAEPKVFPGKSSQLASITMGMLAVNKVRPNVHRVLEGRLGDPA